ncbi:biofilm peroxide resistance protein BsmA [Sodalis sp. dw_96]|uniref:biofilm peroxide resistance protein BsmA n=1 Tax=Sodalis sp. dw_96 TaxID=2719794 RepID=UPI001BD61541|nr:biofilm peroxide resistance protein BsmA [Sodalis sp. dw_96]
MKPLSVMVTALGLLALTGCSILEGKPVPPPPPTHQAQEIQRDQAGSLQVLDRITVVRRGSPMDVEHAVRVKANAAHATYYQIVALSELVTSGKWRADVILYR